MAQEKIYTHDIFLSYSRKDLELMRQVRSDLQAAGFSVWTDEGIDPGTPLWDEAIENALKQSGCMVVILTPNATNAKGLRDEIHYANIHQVRIFPLLAAGDDRSSILYRLSGTQWVDIRGGAYAIGIQKIIASVAEYLDIKKSPQAILQDEAKPSGRPAWLFPVVIAAVLMLFVLVLVLFPRETGAPETTPDSAAQTDAPEVAVQPTPTQADSQTVEASETPSATPTVTPTITTTASITPPPTATLDIALVVATLDAEATLAQATLNAQATAAARATDYAVGTQSAVNQTATATLWTHTPTPDITASIDAFRTQQAATATQSWIDSWTDTPTPTHTPSNTPTATATYTPTQTLTPTATPTATLTELDAALARARAFTGTNEDWTPFYGTFEDGVEMALVPAGCFMMGSNEGSDDEQPVREQCFSEPFWIDRTEVTQGDFVRLGGVAADENYFNGVDRPRESITWFEARDFCALREARLPTEREWEYAARGPDSWVYPWGDAWNANNAVWDGNSDNQTATVGSRPSGASWVGALDMSGNVWEWVSSLYTPYPYNANDGREDVDNRTDARVLRGGSFFDTTFYLRAPGRYGVGPGNENYYFGVRCARSLE